MIPFSKTTAVVVATLAITLTLLSMTFSAGPATPRSVTSSLEIVACASASASSCEVVGEDAGRVVSPGHL
jgi:hypothetical protein